MNIEVPPIEMSGRGCPETGNRPVFIPMWNRACKVIITAIPMMSNAGKAREHFLAIIPARARRNKYNNSTTIAPINPSSSMIIE